MKTLLFSFVLLSVTASLLLGQDSTIKEATISVPTIKCYMCVKTIKHALNKLDGVNGVSIDLKKKMANIQFDQSKISVEMIEKTIAQSGYDANEVKRDKEAYKKLDVCCQ